MNLPRIATLALVVLVAVMGLSAYTPSQQAHAPVSAGPHVQAAPAPVRLSGAIAPVKVAERPIDPAMLAYAATGSTGSVAQANLHIVRALEYVRIEAVKAGKDPEDAAKVFAREEILNWRFVSWHAVVANPSLRVWQKVTRWWLHQMSTGPSYSPPVEVPGSYGLLWQLDLRDYGWNASAWRAVALREPFTREGHVDPYQAALLRKSLGEKAIATVERLLVNGKHVDLETVPAIGVIRADWFFRETIESERSTSYYDLLYARERFPVHAQGQAVSVQVPRVVRQYVWDAQYRAYVARDVTVYETVTQTQHVAIDPRKAVVDFPRDRNDWDAFWGIKATRDFLARQKFDIRYGAIVPGGRSEPGGSIVARNDRVTVFFDTPVGLALESIDFAKTARRADPIEQPVEVTLGEVKAEAAELLFTSRLGAQAGLLVDAAGKRLEFANGRFVHPRSVDTRTPDVRTMMGCVVCHAPHGGLIPPRNLFKEFLEKGIDLKIRDRVQRNSVRAFMLEFDHRIKGWQSPYFRLIEQATADPVLRTPPLSPTELVREFLAFRDWYDSPVDTAQAAREFGVPESYLKALAAKTTTARASAMVQGLGAPREAFDADVFFHLTLAQKQYGGLR